MRVGRIPRWLHVIPHRFPHRPAASGYRPTLQVFLEWTCRNMVGLGTELGINGELLLFLHNNQGDEAITGGDGGIRTLDRALQPYNGLANRRLQPLGHVSNKADMPDAGASRKRQILGLRNAQPNQRLQRVYRRFPIAMPPLWAGSFAM